MLFPIELDLDEVDAFPPPTESDDAYDGPPRSEPREDEMDWEFDAREAVESSLREAKFDVNDDDEGVVTLPRVNDGDKYGGDVECYSVEELVDELRERAAAAWHATVPLDNGPAFEFPGDDLIYQALSDYEDELAKLGWEL